ncbi:MAG: 3-oxoacyl-ACP synthase III [Puniceicoccales bacterium]|jgi:3-oxoacyl-[acyl-carrier-protein] synthase-3|nr:3-oxoacyl-ACP synthase III [Puniceicoccales bacterium]
MNFSFSKVIIESMGHVLPPQVITSEEIEDVLGSLYERLRLPRGRLQLMTGIRERRAWKESTLPSQGSTEAAQKALDKTSIPREAIALLIHTSVCRDHLEPATAAYVHHNLRLSSQAAFFDLSNACLGFINGMVLAASLIEGGQIPAALIVSGENGKPLLEHTLDFLKENQTMTRQGIKSYFANLTIGSGAVAAILCHESLGNKEKTPWRFKAVSSLSDTEGCHLCQGDAIGKDRLTMETASEELMGRGIALAHTNWQQFLRYTGLTIETLGHTICHQVGERHRALLYRHLALDLGKDFSTFPFLGNTGSVALPLTLSLAIENRVLTPGERVALLAIGSGLSSMMALVENV